MGNRMTVGEIREHFRDERGVSFEWAIPDSVSKPEKKKYCYCSPEIKFSDSVWTFSITPNKEGNGACVALSKESESTPKPICISFGAKKLDGTEEEIVCDQRFSETATECVLTESLHISDLPSHNIEIGPSSEVIFTCTLRNDEQPSIGEKKLVSRETQTEDLPGAGSREEGWVDLDTKGGVILRKQLKRFLLESRNHDVTLKVKDKEFKAHKNILGARSPVFEAMFTHGMKESECGSVSIEDCDPGAFGEFLQYIYSGSVENLSPSIAMGLYYAADKYQFSELKEACVEYLKTSLSTSVISDVITFAITHSEDELLASAVEFFSKHLEEILITVEWQRFFMQSPMQANELYIKALKTSYKKLE